MGYFIKQTGLITYNPGTNEMNYFNGVDTVVIGKSGMVTPVINSIVTAGASAGPYTMTVDYSTFPGPSANNSANILVFLDGIFQEPTTSYTISGTDLTFTAVPPDGLTITVVHGVFNTYVPNGSVF